MSTMRVLWVHNFPATTAASGVFMRTLLGEMQSLGVDISLHDTGYLRGPLRIMGAARRLRAVSRAYDLVHAQFGSACGYVASFARPTKLLTFRGTDLLGMDAGPLRHRMHGVACRWLNRSALRSYRCVIVMSERMRRELKQTYHADAAIEVLPSGVNLERFQPMERMDARRRLGHGNDASPWILFSSAASEPYPIKRAPLARSAYEWERKHHPDAEFKFLAGQTHEHVPLWINASNVVLLTSTREGWPNIVKEALACNVPFVSTEVSDLAAIAAAEPSCTVADATPQALAEGILTALCHDRSANLRKHVKQMAVGAIARRLKRLYETIVVPGE